MHLTSREIYTALTSSVKHFPHTLFLSLDLVYENRLNTTNIFALPDNKYAILLAQNNKLFSNYFSQILQVEFTLENNLLFR